MSNSKVVVVTGVSSGIGRVGDVKKLVPCQKSLRQRYLWRPLAFRVGFVA
jgi:short-subunit dehydrogenase